MLFLAAVDERNLPFATRRSPPGEPVGRSKQVPACDDGTEYPGTWTRSVSDPKGLLEFDRSDCGLLGL
jgi:hypothetical protein